VSGGTVAMAEEPDPLFWIGLDLPFFSFYLTTFGTIMT